LKKEEVLQREASVNSGIVAVIEKVE